MRLELIPNRGPASMGSEIQRSLSWCSESRLATAFLTSAGLQSLKLTLKAQGKNQKMKRILLIVGLYNLFTDPKALRELCRMQKQTKGNLEVRVSRNPRFHWKCYLFRNHGEMRSFVGSANLTSDGLIIDGELCLKITAPSTTPIQEAFSYEFDRIWHKDTFALTDRFVTEYAKLPRPNASFVNGFDNSKLKNLLRKLIRPRRGKMKINRSLSHRLNASAMYIADVFGKETEKIISSKTDWDNKDYWYFTLSGKRRWEYLKKNEYFLLVTWFNQTTKAFRVEFHRVADAVRLRTPDGEYFIAHKRVSHSDSKVLKRVQRNLSINGLSLSRIKKEPVLTPKQTNFVCDLLEVPKSVRFKIRGG